MILTYCEFVINIYEKYYANGYNNSAAFSIFFWFFFHIIILLKYFVYIFGILLYVFEQKCNNSYYITFFSLMDHHYILFDTISQYI